MAELNADLIKEVTNRRDAMAHRCLRGIRIPMDILVKTNAEFEKFSGVPASLEYKIKHSGRTIYG